MIEIDVVRAWARNDGEDLDLPPRELALLVALALPPRVWPSYQLIPLLWPQAEISNSSSLKVYVHRLRRRLGHELIASTNRGYELERTTRVDFWDIQKIMDKDALTEGDRFAISRYYGRALSADRSMLTRSLWFTPVEKLIGNAIAELPLRLAADAFARNEGDECLAIARSALAQRPGDHRLREIAIRAHLRRSDQLAALREYEDFLAEHRKTHVVDAPIAASLRNLISSAPAPRRILQTRQPALSS